MTRVHANCFKCKRAFKEEKRKFSISFDAFHVLHVKVILVHDHVFSYVFSWEKNAFSRLKLDFIQGTWKQVDTVECGKLAKQTWKKTLQKMHFSAANLAMNPSNFRADSWSDMQGIRKKVSTNNPSTNPSNFQSDSDDASASRRNPFTDSSFFPSLFLQPTHTFIPKSHTTH